MVGDVQKLLAAAKENDEQQSQIFRLEVRLAEANKKLEHTADLEKELLHYRWASVHCSTASVLRRTHQFHRESLCFMQPGLLASTVLS